MTAERKNYLLEYAKESRFYFTKDKKHLLTDDTPLWRLHYGKLELVLGEKILEQYSPDRAAEIVDDCVEKGIANL